MRPGRILLLVIPLFILTLLVRLPAAWLTGLLPQPLLCAGAGGTIWEGYCRQVRVDSLTWNGLQWELHPLPLLTGTVSVTLQSTDPDAPGAARVQWRGHSLAVQDLRLDLPPALSATLLPAGWSGALSLDIDSGRLEQQRLSALQGSATVQNLSSTRPPLQLGGFRLLVPPQPAGDVLHGTFADLGNGPLAVNGTLALQTASSRYEVSGVVSARAGADDNLKNLLGLIGAADAQGRHSFSVSGSL